MIYRKTNSRFGHISRNPARNDAKNGSRTNLSKIKKEKKILQINSMVTEVVDGTVSAVFDALHCSLMWCWLRFNFFNFTRLITTVFDSSRLELSSKSLSRSSDVEFINWFSSVQKTLGLGLPEKTSFSYFFSGML